MLQSHALNYENKQYFKQVSYSNYLRICGLVYVGCSL